VATKILRVCKGDSVTFRWAGDTPHNVVSVPAWAWSACGLASTTTIAPVSMSGSKTVKFRVGSKSYSYICSVFGHCEMGQRLRVSVSSWCK
jgi:plastocyanin